MGKIFYLMGKSASGKDTVYKSLLNDAALGLQPLVMYTTRPIRSGETNGAEYFFTDEAGLAKIKSEGRLIELRTYHTAQGVWHYFTAHYDGLDLKSKNYLGIGTLESFRSMSAYYGPACVVPLYLEVDDRERLQRALDRENGQEHPKYREMCRRFLADCDDFSEQNIREAGIRVRFQNNDLPRCLCNLKQYIRKNI